MKIDTITQSNTQYTYYQGFPSYHYSHYQVSNYPVQASPIINNSSQIQTNYHYMEQKQFQEGENNTKHNIGQYSHPEIPTRGDHEERSELTSTHQFQ